MHTANTFNLNHLHSHSLSCQPHSLAVALHAHSHGLAEYMSAWTFNHQEIFECAHLKFTVSGQSKHSPNKHAHMHVQCSHTSVGLVVASLRHLPH